MYFILSCKWILFARQVFVYIMCQEKMYKTEGIA